MEFYTSAINLDEKNHIYFSNRANAYLEMEKYDEAISDCKKSIEIEPKFVKSYFRFAKALIEKK